MSGRGVRFFASLAVAVFIADWQHKLRLLLTGIIMLQFAEWFDVYWLKDTEWLVRAGLAAAFVTEFFPRVPVWMKRITALLLIILLHLGRLNITFNPFRTDEGVKAFLASAGESISAALAMTAPYIWFSIGAYVVYLFSVYWLRERARIMVYIVLSVILFAVVDSYSKHILWDQVAFIVFSGLGLIIIEHYEHFRSKHPASWSYLAEYPGKVALPIILIITVVMTAGTLAPNARPLLKDPYTIYKHWLGEKVITGGKGFPTASSGSIPTLDSSSGYGREDGELGGGFEFDYSEVMRVTTTHRSYWRGETKSSYTGSGWVLSEADIDASTERITTGVPLSEYDWGIPSVAVTVEAKQRVVLTEESSYPVLFGASPIRSVSLEPEQITINEAGERQVIPPESVDIDARWSPQQGELRWGDSEPYPLVYELVSALPVTDEAGWRTVAETAFDGDLWEPYLQLPDALPQRVRDLAADIAADAETPYDKVKSIEAYLQENYTYNNRPDLEKGRSEDFVDRFLFEIEEGYCDYFSSAMAVMVRSLGLPTRWVKGFKSGATEMDEIFEGGLMPEELLLMSENGEGTYIVRNSDAHSWVEVYFAGYGWIPFEPTSGMVMPTVIGSEEAVPVVAGSVGELAEAQDDEAGAWQLSPIWMIIAAGLVVLAGIAAYARKFRLPRRLAALWRRNRDERSLNQQALLEIGRIFRLFRSKGYARSTHETARESFARWSNQNKWLKKDLAFLLGVLEKAKYSPYSVTTEDMSAVFQTKKRLKEQL